MLLVVSYTQLKCVQQALAWHQLGRVGAMLGPTIAGQLLAAGFGAAGVISAAIPCIVISAVFMLILVRRLDLQYF